MAIALLNRTNRKKRERINHLSDVNRHNDDDFLKAFFESGGNNCKKNNSRRSNYVRIERFNKALIVMAETSYKDRFTFNRQYDFYLPITNNAHLLIIYFIAARSRS
jgi:hypothetical protein